MSNNLTNDTKVIILLCGVLGKDRSIKPLSQTEYNSLARWLVGKKMRPDCLLDQKNIHDAGFGSGIDTERLKILLGRGVQLGFAVEEWQRNGIWVISRSDADYPIRYKTHLKDKAPPILFGAGNKSLLKGGGVAIIGSRNVSTEGEVFTRDVASLCAYNSLPTISGGARGVDQTAMTAALDAGGTAVGVLAENLLRKSLERNARNSISAGRLLLISPYHPNARFTVGTAMGRNKLIYALADYGLVVSADKNRGGTWAGAEEELKRDNSLPVFVRSGENSPDGNKKLLEMGAFEWPETINKINLNEKLSDFKVLHKNKSKQENMSLFGLQENETSARNGSNDRNLTPLPEPENDPTRSSTLPPPEEAIYQAVLPVIQNQLTTPVIPKELSKTLNVSKAQLSIWLDKAVEDGHIQKLSRPVRFLINKAS
jgi:predicted Rossmann fold nucleotide-binding protein DprA/Smf involved in DNA uptake